MGEILKFKAVVTIELPKGQIVLGWLVNGQQLNENVLSCPIQRVCEKTAELAGWKSFSCVFGCSGFLDGQPVVNFNEGDLVAVNEMLAGASGKENHQKIFKHPGVKVFDLTKHHQIRPNLKLVAIG